MHKWMPISSSWKGSEFLLMPLSNLILSNAGGWRVIRYIFKESAVGRPLASWGQDIERDGVRPSNKKVDLLKFYEI